MNTLATFFTDNMNMTGAHWLPLYNYTGTGCDNVFQFVFQLKTSFVKDMAYKDTCFSL